MTKEDFEKIRLQIRQRSELERFYINQELEKFVNFGLIPEIPPRPLYSAIMDFITYGTDTAREKVLNEIRYE